jgi:hypothetical protein
MESIEDLEYDDTLGYYDTDEDIDYSQYNYNEEPITNTPLSSNRQHMYLPIDTMKEILRHSDIESFITICKSSKDSAKICTNELWVSKFNQNNIPIYEPIPTTTTDWLNLYHLSMVADKYINTFLKQQYTISLQRELTNEVLGNIISNIKHMDFKPSYFNARKNYYRIHFNTWQWLPYQVAGISLTYQELKEFIYQLFFYRYLLEKNIRYNKVLGTYVDYN